MHLKYEESKVPPKKTLYNYECDDKQLLSSNDMFDFTTCHPGWLIEDEGNKQGKMWVLEPKEEMGQVKLYHTPNQCIVLTCDILV